jgi:hypothetical protein
MASHVTVFCHKDHLSLIRRSVWATSSSATIQAPASIPNLQAAYGTRGMTVFMIAIIG